MKYSSFSKNNGGTGRKAAHGKNMAVWKVVMIDILVFAVCLVTFAYFHHVNPIQLRGPEPTRVIERPTPTQRPTETVDPSATLNPSATVDVNATPEPDWGTWGRNFPDKFAWDGTVTRTENSYKSKNINITVERVAIPEDDMVYYVCDIYLRDIDYIKSKLAHDTFAQGTRDAQEDMVAETGAILAINGDYYGARDQGIAIRNGVVYREKAFKDVCVLYYDGTMKCFSKSEFNMDDAVRDGAYQAWGFGPMLLKDGQPMTEFDCSINSRNPRSVLGYYEPGHYCFVAVAGRRGEPPKGEGRGMTTAELSKLMYDLGCKEAYNMDGGATSMLFFDGKLVNVPAGDGGRKCSDMIYIGE
ncbi:MAG: phosphodiester glycosidase family protein [Clostridiales bacterium]|nr:phosphodiester glycosidase family protein [Clostridiales bacterium]